MWNFFKFRLNEDGDFVDKNVTVCTICRAEMKYCGNTTNLSNHLDRFHHAARHGGSEGPKVQKQPSVAGLFGKPKEMPIDSPTAKKLTRSVAGFIVREMQPLSIVSSVGLRTMLKDFRPDYKLPSRPHFTDVVLRGMYQETRGRVQAELSKASGISLTTDGWTSAATQGYITITAHALDSKFSLQSFVLQTREMTDSHTAANLSAELSAAEEEWGISRLNPIYVTDNARNITNAVRDMGKLHVGCMAHTINLCVRKVYKLDAVDTILSKCRKIVGHFKRSTTASSLLKEKQELLKLPQHTLLQDVETRWNSAHDMMVRIVEQEPAICAALLASGKSKDRDLLLTEEEMASLRGIISVLEPFKTATTLLSSQEKVTSSIMLPMLHKLRSSSEPKEGDTDVQQACREAILQDLRNRYTTAGVTKFMELSASLDPRFKLLPFLTAPQRAEALDMLRAEATKLAEAMPPVASASTKASAVKQESANQMVSTKEEPTVSRAPSPLPTDGPPPTKRTKISPSQAADSKTSTSCIDGFFDDVMITSEEPAPVLSCGLLVSREMERFAHESSIALSESPLQWWAGRSQVYPILGQLARKYLCVPATSVPSERVFSVAGNIVTDKRSRLHPSNVDMLIFLNMNHV